MDILRDLSIFFDGIATYSIIMLTYNYVTTRDIDVKLVIACVASVLAIIAAALMNQMLWL